MDRAPELSAMAQVLALRFGLNPFDAERRALHLLNDLGTLGWALDRTPEGMKADSRAECLALAAEAEADGDHEDADWFLARAAA